MSQERKKPKNVVFQPTYGFLNTVLNFQRHTKAAFILYGEAYHRAGKHLLDGITARELPYHLDSLPVVYLYRHALELHMKSIIILGNKFLRLQDEEAVAGDEILREHRLTALLTPVEKILDFMRWKDDGFEYGCIKNFGDCRAVIESVNAIDARSYAFRYPVDTKGNASVDEQFAFDVRRVAERMDAVIELFSTVAFALDHEYDRLCEAIADSMQQE